MDDYCPRERRVTNHAVVAMVEEDVKQTRCTTCDAEHVYKGGKAPRRKKSETTGALYKEVLAGISDQETPSAAVSHAMPAPHDDPDAETGPVGAEESISAERPQASSEPVEEEPQPDMPVDEGPVHRPLIRAQLPRPEGLKIERQAPEFTIRQNSGRGGSNFRGGDMRAGGRGGGAGNNGGGHRFGRGPNRGGGGGGGRSGGPNQGFGRGPGGPSRGPRKRSR
ncbi:MAG TPA: hypothetical protein VEL79_06070 [Vicinamibacterales bacterium]|nr:hypothetical protein [Vicinamibacterales bacterium]